MTKLKDQSTKLTAAIKELENELKKYNKNDIKADINLKSKMNNLLENLMENADIQKNYPRYEKLKKLFYIIPSLSVTALTVLIILLSLLLGNLTFTVFAPLLILAADFITYNGLTKICDKKINDNEAYKEYFDIYGNKQYSAKRTLKDVRINEKEIEKDKELLEEISTKETKLSRLNNLLDKLNGIKDEYVEKTLGDEYSTEITNVSEAFQELETPPVQKPRQIIKK